MPSFHSRHGYGDCGADRNFDWTRGATVRAEAKAYGRRRRAALLSLGTGATVNHRNGLLRFRDDGRVAVDTITVERAIRTICLSRSNALLASETQPACDATCNQGIDRMHRLNTPNRCIKLDPAESWTYLSLQRS